MYSNSCIDRVRKSAGGGPLVALQLVQLLQLVSLNFFPFEKTICNREDLNFFYLRRKFKHGSKEKNRTGPTGATSATGATGATGATDATGATSATSSQEKKNWPNWRNWRNWRNWGNWRNQRNWRN